MTLAPLLQASATIQAHAYAAFVALGLGTIQLLAPKGTLPHRAVGWTWVMLMMAVAGTSLFIHTIRVWGPFSPIHLLSLLTLGSVPLAVWSARRGDIGAHRRAMTMLFAFALVITGFFTLWPGRIMHEVVFGA